MGSMGQVALDCQGENVFGHQLEDDLKSSSAERRTDQLVAIRLQSFPPDVVDGRLHFLNAGNIVRTNDDGESAKPRRKTSPPAYPGRVDVFRLPLRDTSNAITMLREPPLVAISTGMSPG